MKTYKLYGLDVANEVVMKADVDSGATVDQYADVYISSKSGVEGKTLDHYRGYMRNWISPVFGQMPLVAVTPETIARWVNGMAAGGSQEKSIKNRHGFLFAMFAHAVNRGLIDRNPCQETRISATEKVDMLVLTVAEYAHLREEIPKQYQPFIDLLLMTGMRFGEATALRKSDFNTTNGTVKIARAWKYSADKSWYIGPPKTKKAVRTVSLPPEWQREILPLVEACKSEYVFTNGAGRAIRQSTFYKAVWNPARRRAWGLPPEKDRNAKDETQLPRVHDLRHTHASWLVASGLPLSYVQERMGHESINTTISVYSSVAPDYLAVTAKAMSSVLVGALPS